jgi:DNA-directed RNA polymerase subunit M/transcription elongation factor TFIIS
MGPEKATSASAVTSNFANGVSVKIMTVGVPWANRAMMNYTPENEPAPTPQQELSEPVVHCPKCHSEEVVFDGLINDGLIGDGQINDDQDNDGPIGESAAATGNSQPKFGWTCDSCGYRWKDDGIVEQ